MCESDDGDVIDRANAPTRCIYAVLPPAACVGTTTVIKLFVCLLARACSCSINLYYVSIFPHVVLLA